MRVNRWLVPVIAIVILLGSVPLAKVNGWWQTSGVKLITVEDVSPDDIRGSSTLGDVSAAFGIPMDELVSILNLPEAYPEDTKLKDLEGIVEVGVARGLIAQHLGIPWEYEEHEPSEEAVLATPEPTVPEPTAVSSPTAPTPAPASAESAASETDAMPAADIKGRMTLAEVSDLTGIPKDVLYKELGLASDVPATVPLRDLKETVEGFETSIVREVVEAYQASH